MSSLVREVGLRPRAAGRWARIGPWSGQQLAAVVLADALACALASLGWWQASAETKPGDQIGWLNISLIGAVVAIGANGLFLARGRQTVRVATAATLSRGHRSGRSMPSASALNRRSARATGLLPPAMPASTRPRDATCLSVAGTKRYHRPECALVAGRPAHRGAAVEFDAAGLQVCEVCEP